MSPDPPNVSKMGERDIDSAFVGEMKMAGSEPRLLSLLQNIMREDVSLIPTDSEVNREYVNTIRFFQYAAQQEGKQTIRNMYSLFSQSPFYIASNHTTPVVEKPIPVTSEPLLSTLSPSFFTITHSSHSPSTQSVFLAVLHTIRSEFDVTIITAGLSHDYTFSA